MVQGMKSSVQLPATLPARQTLLARSRGLHAATSFDVASRYAATLWVRSRAAKELLDGAHSSAAAVTTEQLEGPQK